MRIRREGITCKTFLYSLEIQKKPQEGTEISKYQGERNLGETCETGMLSL